MINPSTVFQYNPVTGELVRLATGKTVSTHDQDGYITTRFQGKTCKAHRIAWLIIHGEWPKGEIDHINGARDDNRISNLRVVTSMGNHQNRIEHRNGRLLGTSFHKKTKKWRAIKTVNGTRKHIGYFHSEKEAHKAYLSYGVTE